MKQIPFVLIYSRLIIAFIIGGLAFSKINHLEIWIVGLMILGLLTDIFDGIIARKLNVASEKLRIWDSTVDLFFWLITIASIFKLNINFVKQNLLWLILVVFLELMCYLISYIKFKKPIATHSYLAKAWTITLLLFLIDLALNSTSHFPFIICIALGIISRLEIILIILKLKKWTTDVSSIFKVNRINMNNETVSQS